MYFFLLLAIKKLEEIISEKTQSLENILKDHNAENTMFKTKLDELTEALSEQITQSNATNKAKDEQIDNLKADIDNLQKNLEHENQKVVEIENEKTNLLQQLEQMNVHKNNIEKEYLSKCDHLNGMTNELNNEILIKKNEINKLKNDLEDALKDNVAKVEGKIVYIIIIKYLFTIYNRIYL